MKTDLVSRNRGLSHEVHYASPLAEAVDNYGEWSPLSRRNMQLWHQSHYHSNVLPLKNIPDQTFKRFHQQLLSWPLRTYCMIHYWLQSLYLGVDVRYRPRLVRPSSRPGFSVLIFYLTSVLMIATRFRTLGASFAVGLSAV